MRSVNHPGHAARPKRVLLVEVLDAAGADAADAREHAELLKAAGATVDVQIVAAEPRFAGENTPDPARSGVSAWHEPGAAGLASLRDSAADGNYDLALIASASTGGGKAARALRPILPTRWWPTAIAVSPGWTERWRPGGAAPVQMPESNGVAVPGLEWSSVDGERVTRGRPTLWDGDYVLVPLPPSGADGPRVMTAFLAAAERHTSLDLLILSERLPDLERLARQAGVGGRVHFIGAAPREAEWTWWRYATAGLLAGDLPCAGGFVLRALALGCPLVLASDRREWTSVGRWLAHHGCLGTPAGTSAGERLARTLERGADVVHATARGRELALAHVPVRLAPRFAAAVGGLSVAPAALPPAAAA
jgi:hypothetical protein